MGRNRYKLTKVSCTTRVLRGALAFLRISVNEFLLGTCDVRDFIQSKQTKVNISTFYSKLRFSGIFSKYSLRPTAMLSVIRPHKITLSLSEAKLTT